MRIITHFGAKHGSTLAAGIAILALASLGETAEHPTLVDPEKAKCATCHEEVVQGRVRHAPAEEGCLSCHEFTRQEKQLTVELVSDGPELCLICHDGMSDFVEGEVKAPHAPLSDDCTNCHNPHSAAEEHLLVAPALELCFSCHDPATTDSGHPIPVSRADCRTCHAPHGSDTDHMLSADNQHAPFEEGSCDACHRIPRGTRVRLQVEGAELCYACHGDLEEDFARGHVHTAVAQGACTGCHSPHLAQDPNLLEASGGDLCLSCHRDIEEKSSGEAAHAALSYGCETCHDPHRSEYPAQLIAEVGALCLSCHDSEDRQLADLHLGADLGSVRCTECHDPHGSSEPHLLASGSLHPPFVDDCANCHDGAANKLVAGGSDLCFACHDGVQAEVDGASVPHPAMEVSECVDCHSPHASSQPKLLQAPGGEICTPCHEDQVPAHDEVNHGAIDWLGCQSCHFPHGSENNFLLRASGNELCNGCHLAGEVIVEGDEVTLAGGFVLRSDRARSLKVVGLDASRERDHPIPSHPVSGTIAEKRRSDLPKSLIGTQMTCLSCHVSHTAPSRQLFAFGAASRAELCTACHPK